MATKITRKTGIHICQSFEAYRFDFDVSTTEMTRSGDDIVMKLADGHEITLKDFCAVRSLSIVADGEEMPAAKFFASFGQEDLAPDEGGLIVADNLRSHAWSEAKAMEGLWHLDGLDLAHGMAEEAGIQLSAGPDAPLAAPSGGTSGNPGRPDGPGGKPGDPAKPDNPDNPDNPDSPDNPGNPDDPGRPSPPILSLSAREDALGAPCDLALPPGISIVEVLENGRHGRCHSRMANGFTAWRNPWTPAMPFGVDWRPSANGSDLFI